MTTGRDVYGKYGWAQCQKGLSVGRDGTIYAFHMKTWLEDIVVRWTPEGKAIDGFLTGSFLNTAGLPQGGRRRRSLRRRARLAEGHTLPWSPRGFVTGSSVVKFKPTTETTDDGKAVQPAAATAWQGHYAAGQLGGAITAYPYQSPNGASGRPHRLYLQGGPVRPGPLRPAVHPQRADLPNAMVDNAGNVIGASAITATPTPPDRPGR